MAKAQLQPRNAAETLVVERALLLMRELQRTCTAAPDGQVLGQAEDVILTQGREFLRVALQASLQEQSATAEKKGRRAAPVDANDGVMGRPEDPGGVNRRGSRGTPPFVCDVPARLWRRLSPG